MIANQTYSINEDDTLLVAAANGLLSGTSDVDGDPLEVFNHTQPPNGRVTVQKNGSFVYMPNPNYNGQDNFQFIVTDKQGGFTRGTVTIQIGAWPPLMQLLKLTLPSPASLSPLPRCMRVKRVVFFLMCNCP